MKEESLTDIVRLAISKLNRTSSTEEKGGIVISIFRRWKPKGKMYSLRCNQCGSGFLSSFNLEAPTAFTVIEYVDNLAHVIYSKQFENSSTEHMVSHAWNLIRQYNLNNGINKVFIDGSQPGFIRSLKIAIGEYAQYEHFVEKAKQDNRPLHLYMNIVPVSFSTAFIKFHFIYNSILSPHR